MPNAQEWLDENYPKNERSTIKKLDISKNWNTSDNEKLTGSLDVSDFINLERLYCSFNNLTNLILPNNSKLIKINCSYNNLTALTITNHSLLRELDCSYNNKLTTLIVTDNVNLTILKCSDCQLTTLNLTNNPLLAELRCQNNQLTNWNWLTNCNNENKLTHLSIWNNKLTGDLAELAVILTKFNKLERLYLTNNPLIGGELVSLSELTNLQELYLDNLNITGSLQALQGCSKLKKLSIENTNITSGLEYLPKSLARIYCQGTKLAEELKDYDNDYWTWRKKNTKLIDKVKELQQLITEARLTDYIQKNNIDLLVELPKYKWFYETNVSIATLFKRWIKDNEHILYQQELINLQEKLKRLENEKERLIKRNSDLETLTTESARLITEEKTHISNTYLSFFSEEEDKYLQELIKIHKDYILAKKQEEEVSKVRKQLWNLLEKLENKLGKIFIERVEKILTKFEQLYQYELMFNNYSIEKQQIPTKLTNIEQHISEITKDIKTIKDNPQQVINNKYLTIGDIKLEQGHLIMGDVTGENIDLSHNTNTYQTVIEEELTAEEQLQTNIEQLPKLC